MECCRDGCPSGSFSHLHRVTLDLCQSDHRVLSHLPDQGPSPSITQFGWAASSRKSLGYSKLLPFKNDGGHCVLRDFKCCIFWYPSPDLCLDTILSRRSIWTIPLISRLGICSDRCLPFQIMSNQLNLPQVDSNQVVETSQG